MLVENKKSLAGIDQGLQIWETPVCKQLSISMTFEAPNCSDSPYGKSLGNEETFALTSTTSIVCGS